MSDNPFKPFLDKAEKTAAYWKERHVMEQESHNETRAELTRCREEIDKLRAAITALKGRDWQVIALIPNGVIEVDCNSGEQRTITYAARQPKDQ
jgi:hypothetical protein